MMPLVVARRIVFAAAIFASWLGPGAAVQGYTIVLITNNNGSLTAEESARRTTLQSMGHTVNTLWDGASASAYDTALATADLVYVPEECMSGDVGYKLRLATVGVLSEESFLDDEIGFSTSDGASASYTQINIVEPAYGLVTILSSAQPLIYMQGTVAAGFNPIAYLPGGQLSVGTIEAGAPLANTYNGNSVAAGRRMRLPWGGDSFAWSSLNASGVTVLQLALAWVAEKPLLLHWKLDEAAGTAAADSSSFARTGTVTNGAWTSSTVHYRGLSLTGTGRVQAAGLLNNPANFSVAAWAKINGLDSSGADIISIGDYVTLRVTTTALQARFYNGSGYTTVSYATSLAGTGWHHLAATFDNEGNNFRLYLDGAPVASLTTTAAISYAGLGTNTVAGAHGHTNTTYDLTGTLDDVRVYSKILTATEVLALYGPTGYWRLDETSGTTAADSSGAALDGVYAGGYVLAKAGVRENAVGIGATASDRITLPREALHGATSATVAFWLKTTRTGSQAVVSAAKVGTDNELLLFFETATEFRVYIHGAYVSWNIPTAADGRWHHYLVTTVRESNSTSLYRDGSLVGVRAISPGAGGLSVASGGLIIGQEQDSVGGGFEVGQQLVGDLDDLRFFNRALTGEEIADVYGLSGHWRFDDGAGTTIADSSGAGRHAAFANGAPQWTTGVRAGSLQFNGLTDDAITDAIFSPPSTGTVVFWFKSNGLPAARERLFGLGGDWEAWRDPDGLIRFDLCGDGNVGGFLTVSSLADAGRWYHLAAVFDSANDSYQVYVNGELDKAGTATVNLVTQAAEKLSFATRTGTAERMAGALDDFRVYNRKLTASEIKELYGLVGWYKLDETVGAVATDSSGLGNNGTFVGSPNLGVSNNGNAALGNAVEFNGTNYVQIPTLFQAPESITVAGWSRLDASDSSGAELVSLGDCFILRLQNGAASAHRYNGSNWTTISASQVIANTGWRHFAATYDAVSGFKLYIDGVEAASGAYSAPIMYSGLGASTTIARHGNGQATFDLDGRVDDVRIFNRALAPTDVYQLFRGTRLDGLRMLQWVEVR